MSEDTFRWAVAGGVGLSALCFLVLAIAAVVMARVVLRFHQRVAEINESAVPLIETVRRVAGENGPKISVIASRMVEIAGNAKEISEVAKDQAHRFGEVGRDIADRAKAQAARVDAAVDHTIDRVEQAGDNVRTASVKPVREATAVLAGVRAAVHAYANGKRLNIEHVTQDEEMFI
jgi:hypothetical protein